MPSGRLRLICWSAAMAAVFVVGAASTAAASLGATTPDGGGLAPPPSAVGCETQPGPVMQTLEYAGCQTVAVVDGTMGWACATSGACP